MSNEIKCLKKHVEFHTFYIDLVNEFDSNKLCLD